MLLITSAAYITPGLVSEFGKLPPSMLPVQNRRLYEHQIELVKNGGDIVLSLPKSYNLTNYDKERLTSLGVKLVFVPDEFSLGQSVVYVLNVVGDYSQDISILHGDTLFSSLPNETDICAVAKAEDCYEWDVLSVSKTNIFSGYFAFSNQTLLIQKITESSYNFIDGVRKYSVEVPIKYIELPDWMDFGIVNTYYRSISKMTTQRVFNNMKVTRYSVRKSSTDICKMKAESNWILSLPAQMKHYSPAVWDRGEDGNVGYYEIEYYFLSSLANIYVFGNNKLYVWEEIINACVEYLNDEARFKPEKLDIIAKQNGKLYAVKTLKRLEEYALITGISLDTSFIFNGQLLPALRKIVEEIERYIVKDDMRFVSLMHGDFCFSNILYDFKSKSIKVIDPRGIDTEGNFSIYGDFRYDVAKIAHSIIGMYDFIIGGRFKYREITPYNIELEFEVPELVKQIQKCFLSKMFGGYTAKELSIYPIMIHLFLSMLPLHCDNIIRQKVMLANALRLYSEFKRKY